MFLYTDDNERTGMSKLPHSMIHARLTGDINLLTRKRTYDNSFGNYDYRQALLRKPTDMVTNQDGSWIERDGFNYDNPVSRINETHSDVEAREFRLNGMLS